MFHSDASSLCHAKQSVFSQNCFDAGAAIDELGKIAEHGGTAGHNDAVINDVRSELRRSILKDVLHGFDHVAKFLDDGLCDLVCTQLNRTRQACDKVSAFDRHNQFFVKRNSRAYFYFDSFRHLIADAEIVSLLYIICNGRVYFVSGDLDRSRRDYATERNDGHVSRSTADIYDHVATSLMNGNACADGREHGLLDHISI